MAMTRYRPGEIGKIRKHVVARPIDCDLGIGERISLHVDAGRIQSLFSVSPEREPRACGAQCCVRRRIRRANPHGFLLAAIRAAKRRLHAVAPNCERRGPMLRSTETPRRCSLSSSRRSVSDCGSISA